MTTPGTIETTTTNRRTEEVPPFTASPALRIHLQQVLVDLLELHLQGKQAHWNVVGAAFRALHLQLDEIVDAARDLSDEIAERLRAVGGVPDGRSDTITATTTLPAYPAGQIPAPHTARLMLARLRATATTARDVREEVDADDPSSAGILDGVIDTLEKHAWMLSAVLAPV